MIERLGESLCLMFFICLWVFSVLVEYIIIILQSLSVERSCRMERARLFHQMPGIWCFGDNCLYTQ